MPQRMTSFVSYYFFALAAIWLVVSLALGNIDFMFVVFAALGLTLRYREGARRVVAGILAVTFGLLVLVHAAVIIAWGAPTRVGIAGRTLTSDSPWGITLILAVAGLACFLLPSILLARQRPLQEPVSRPAPV